ncbi:MAG: SxtJ family membrane protein [Verrucomicrobiota bacterium]|jgi:hypothetical protein
MPWSEINSNPDRRVLRQFGGVGFIILGAVAVHQYRFGHHHTGITLAAIALLMGFAGLARPSLLRWLFVGWMKVAFPLNWIVSELMLGLIFYLVLTPLALVFRLAGRDALELRASPGRASYWVRKPAAPEVRRYFRQH